mmetsp:Transcript_22236/g.56971  ORF Transcript_22236/g.56971 Transcript_22236/m.56971 type:complete len:171 (-) Transcript_22236:446-958(-)|eukprot:jgi/Tetstr1/437746/TSEL_026400.t1
MVERRAVPPLLVATWVLVLGQQLALAQPAKAAPLAPSEGRLLHGTFGGDDGGAGAPPQYLEDLEYLEDAAAIKSLVREALRAPSLGLSAGAAGPIAESLTTPDAIKLFRDDAPHAWALWGPGSPFRERVDFMVRAALRHREALPPAPAPCFGGADMLTVSGRPLSAQQSV